MANVFYLSILTSTNMKSILSLLLLFSIPFITRAQSERIVDRNSIGWFTYNGNHQVSKKWAIHTEYQWRRTQFIRSWQQSLARIGAVYSLHELVKVSGGYTNLTTYPYGEHPIAGQMVPNREHRLYEDIQWSQTLARFNLEQRIRVEQRWMGESTVKGVHHLDTWDYANRIRYQLEIQYPLQGSSIDDREFYLTAFDELFINLGKDDNVYNQNRILGGVGYQFNDDLKLELGYLHQITRQADLDPASNRPIYEINQGFRLNLIYGIDFTRKEMPQPGR